VNIGLRQLGKVGYTWSNTESNISQLKKNQFSQVTSGEYFVVKKAKAYVLRLPFHTLPEILLND